MSRYKARKADQVKSRGEATGPQHLITGVWAALMLSLFPVIFTNYYFNILETKFITYCILTGGMLLLLLLWGIFSHRLTAYAQKAAAERKLKSFRVRFDGIFDATDKCVLLFYLISVISTLAAYPYIWQAFTGIEGRYTGLLLLTLYVGAYFCMTRFFHFKKMYVTLFLWFALFVCVFGITDYYKMNIMGFKTRMKAKQYGMFASTIGNINTYTTFVGFVIALAGSLFVLSKEKATRVLFYLVCLAVSFEAIIMGNSDNGYLTLLAFFGFLPFFAFRTRQGIRRYFLTIALFFSVILHVRQVNAVEGSKVLGITGLFNVISGWKHLTILTIALWAVCICLYILDFTTKASQAPAPKLVGRIWKGFFAAVVLGVAALIVKANSMSMDQALKTFGSLGGYLKFSDGWGTNRGIVWRIGLEDLYKLPPIRWIFGTGPDTFGIYMMNMSHDILAQKTGQIYDSAHNEYLQYLFTIGPIGLAAYLGYLINVVRTAFQKADVIDGVRVASEKDRFDVSRTEKIYSPYMTAFAMLVICYATQATVNINLPISTPIFWTFAMMAASVGRKPRKFTETAEKE